MTLDRLVRCIHQMVDPLTVNADVCWWRFRLACTIRRCTGIGWCTSCTRWSARHVVMVVQSQTRVRNIAIIRTVY